MSDVNLDTTTPITSDEWQAIDDGRGRQGNKPAAITIAVSNLAPGTGLKLACHWKHQKPHNVCSGMVAFGAYLRRHQLRGWRFRCRDGTLYAWRDAATS